MDDGLAKDLVAMWQSELTAMAADRELREGFTTLLTLWAGAATVALSTRPHEHQAGSTRTPEPPGSPPAAPAPHAGVDEIERLSRRVDELERRLAERDHPLSQPRSGDRARSRDA